MLQVTPTGPWGKDVHPALPVTRAELLADLRACFRAGADGVHLHVRDESGAETLRPEAVNATAAAVRDLAAELGVNVEIGLTTGAWIVPDLADRLALLREWEGVDCATVNLSEPGFEQTMAVLLERGIGLDVGLWAPPELDALVGSGYLPYAQRVSIELDDGEPYYLTGDPVTIADQLNAALDGAGSTCPRLTHGMGGVDVAARRRRVHPRPRHPRRVRGLHRAAGRAHRRQQRRTRPGRRGPARRLIRRRGRSRGTSSRRSG